MLAARNLILTLCGSVGFLQCASKSDGAARHDADAIETRTCVDDAGQECLCAVMADAATCFENESQVDACGCTPVAPDEAGVVASAPQTCGALGKPLDRVFTSVDVSAAP